MNDYNKYFENLIIEVASHINPKINGILFLELVKYRIIDRLKDDNFIISDEIQEANAKAIFLKERDIELNFRLIFCKSAVANLNTLLKNNILLICIQEDLSININDCKSNKIFNSISFIVFGSFFAVIIWILKIPNVRYGGYAYVPFLIFMIIFYYYDLKKIRRFPYLSKK